MNAKYIFIISLLFLGLHPEGLTSEESLKVNSEKFVDIICKGDPKKAFGFIEPNVLMDKKMFKALAGETYEQLKNAARQLGEPLAFELIDNAKKGNSIIKHTLLMKFSKKGLRWEIVYYKPETQWFITKIHWDDNLLTLFE